MKLNDFQIDQENGQATIPIAWKEIIERCCELKEAIDYASRWPISTRWGSKVKRILASHHLLVSDVPDHSQIAANMPDHFACLVGGKSIFSLRTSTKTVLQRATLPGWATLGWIRKDKYVGTPTLDYQALCNAAMALPSDATTNVIEGIPLFMASEGKNRTQLQRLAGANRETYLRVYARRDTSHLTAMPLAFAPGIVVLEGNGEYELLPFRTASESLLKAVGVTWDDAPSYKPWLGLAFLLGKPWLLGNVEKRIRVGLLKR